MKLFLKIVCCFLFFVSLDSVSTSANPKFVSEKQWKEHIKDYNYDEDYKTIDSKGQSHKTKNSVNFAGIKNILVLFVIIILIILIIYFALSLFKDLRWRIKNTEKTGNVVQIENIEEVDLEGMLQNALDLKKYDDVIRYKYLILIRSLNKQKLIVWKKDKTNGQYIKEMHNKRGFELFRAITHSFERIWYGNSSASESDYQLLLPKFDHMNRIILKIEPKQ